MSYKIIIVNGTGGAGKTTFENYCMDYLGKDNCYIFSTIDFVKHLAKECGWNGEKTLEARKFLSDFKDFLSDTYMGDLTYQDVKKKILGVLFRYNQCEANTDNLVFFVDAREPEQIKTFVETLDAKTVLIRNEKQEQMETSNHADRDVLQFDYDWIINNNGTLEELKEKARVFCQLIRASKT